MCDVCVTETERETCSQTWKEKRGVCCEIGFLFYWIFVFSFHNRSAIWYGNFTTKIHGRVNTPIFHALHSLIFLIKKKKVACIYGDLHNSPLIIEIKPTFTILAPNCFSFPLFKPLIEIHSHLCEITQIELTMVVFKV